MKRNESNQSKIWSWTQIVIAFALAIAFIMTSVGSARAMTSKKRNSNKPTIVLVHGAWADGSSWNAITSELQGRGYTVNVLANPLRGLSADAAYIASILNTIPGPIVLVGHSYGGAVITNAALGNANIKALVYINAFVPDQGESLLQLAS